MIQSFPPETEVKLGIVGKGGSKGIRLKLGRLPN
jgi:hypothetical protein